MALFFWNKSEEKFLGIAVGLLDYYFSASVFWDAKKLSNCQPYHLSFLFPPVSSSSP